MKYQPDKTLIYGQTLEELEVFGDRVGIDKYCDIEAEFDRADKRSDGALDFPEFRSCFMDSD